MKVFITGGTCGLGKSLAKQFLAHGDDVIICSRNPSHVHAAHIELQTYINIKKSHARIESFVADVSDPRGFDAYDGEFDVFISNAGSNAYEYKELAGQTPETLHTIVTTNLLGTAYGYQHAVTKGARHMFFMMGGGSKGESTPTFAMYGASKRGAYHLVKSLRMESSHRLHRVFPGFVDTPLLMAGLTDAIALAIFSTLAKKPDDAAKILVPAMRRIVIQDQPSSDMCVNALTIRAFGLLCLRLMSLSLSSKIR